MNIISKYIAYLKDNPKGYWFKRKMYGWGWTPARWQGWVIILFFLALIIKIALSLPYEPTSGELEIFFAKIILSVGVLIFICYKTGEKPRWQWGIDKQEK